MKALMYNGKLIYFFSKDVSNLRILNWLTLSKLIAVNILDVDTKDTKIQMQAKTNTIEVGTSIKLLIVPVLLETIY